MRSSILWKAFTIAGFLAAILSLVTSAQLPFTSVMSRIWPFSILFRDQPVQLNLEIIPRAYAETGETAHVGGPEFMPWVVLAIFAGLGFAFFAGIYVSYFSNAADKAKIERAENIIKTFGGFFIGVATAYTNQALNV